MPSMDLFKFLENSSWVVGSGVIVTLFVAFAIAGTLLVRRTVKTHNFKGHHDVAGFVFTNLGVLYSVLLGFTVVNVQQRYDKVQHEIQIEASYISQIYRDAEVFSEKDKLEIRTAIKAYLESVIYVEWNNLVKGEPNASTSAALNNIWKTYYSVDLSNKMQELWYAESIDKLNELISARLSRLLGEEESLGSEMWTLLILGGIVMVSFVWFFHVESLVSHLMMTSILAATAAFLLFLIYSLDTIYSGDVSVSPEAYIRILRSFNS